MTEFKTSVFGFLHEKSSLKNFKVNIKILQEQKLGIINPTLHYITLVPGAFQSDLRASKLWYNSLLILTMDVKNFDKLKGVPKKFRACFFEAGAKNQNFKLDPIALKFCMGLQGTNRNFFCFLDHNDLGFYFKVTAI